MLVCDVSMEVFIRDGQWSPASCGSAFEQVYRLLLNSEEDVQKEWNFSKRFAVVWEELFRNTKHAGKQIKHHFKFDLVIKTSSEAWTICRPPGQNLLLWNVGYVEMKGILLPVGIVWASKSDTLGR